MLGTGKQLTFQSCSKYISCQQLHSQIISYLYLYMGFDFLFCCNCRHLFFCVSIGLWAGLVIGYTTEYYTSNAYR